MESPSSVVTEPKPQPEVPAPQAQPSPAQSSADSESRYQRRAEFLGNPGTKWGLILAGLLILVAVFFLWRYLASYESTDDAQIDGHVNAVSACRTTNTWKREQCWWKSTPPITKSPWRRRALNTPTRKRRLPPPALTSRSPM